MRLLKLHACGHNVWEVEHDVVDVDVAMENSPLVQLIESVCNLCQNLLDFALLQRGLSSGDDVVQGPSVDKLLYEDVLALILEEFDQCHTCIGIYHPEDVYLLLQILPPLLTVLFLDVLLVDHLGGILPDWPICVDLTQEHEVDNPHAPATQLSHHLVIVTWECVTFVFGSWFFHLLDY